MSEPFWQTLATRGDALALVDCDSDTRWTYRELHDRVRNVAARLGARRKSLLLLFPESDAESIVFYLGALTAGHAVFLSPLGIQQAGARALIEKYRPEILVWRSGSPDALTRQEYQLDREAGGYQAWTRCSCEDPPPHEALALVLSTSASSGSPKSARLSRAGLAASAAQVSEALCIEAGDRALLALPFSYVYGLSVLNSALHAGCSLVVKRGSLADQQYWSRIAAAQPTTIAAVSHMLEYLRRLEIDSARLPTLRKLTHSGDALDPALFTWAFERFGRRGVDLYLMYGQTEACGRMTVLPPQYLPEMRRSVGRVVRGGELSVDPDGQVIYRGPGVMLGYAHGREELSLGDCLHGILHTGDVGSLDERGFLHLTGRASRYSKVFGRRVSLDDIEAYARGYGLAAVVEKEGVVTVFFELTSPVTPLSRLQLARQFRLPPQCFQVRTLPALPHTQRGKVAYGELVSLA